MEQKRSRKLGQSFFRLPEPGCFQGTGLSEPGYTKSEFVTGYG